MEFKEWEEGIGGYGIYALTYHVFAKIFFEENSIRIAFMDYEIFENAIEAKQISVNHALVEEHMVHVGLKESTPFVIVLTASNKELQNFVVENPDLFAYEVILLGAD